MPLAETQTILLVGRKTGRQSAAMTRKSRDRAARATSLDTRRRKTTYQAKYEKMPTPRRSKTNASSKTAGISSTTPKSWLQKRIAAAQIKTSRRGKLRSRCCSRLLILLVTVAIELNRLIPIQV